MMNLHFPILQLVLVEEKGHTQINCIRATGTL